MGTIDNEILLHRPMAEIDKMLFAAVKNGDLNQVLQLHSASARLQAKDKV